MGDERGYASPSHEEVLAFTAALKPFAGPHGQGNLRVSVRWNPNPHPHPHPNPNPNPHPNPNPNQVSVRWTSAYGRAVDGACGQL